ncbi:MAG: hypothetical protein HUK03_01690 [Bacteroidaceae bacterium]|nr:hypothetical protein [Bacteroidaceae bacterium]
MTDEELTLIFTNEGQTEGKAESGKAQPDMEAEPKEDDAQETSESEGKQLVNALFTDEEEQEQEIRRLKDVIKALSIDGMWFRRQLGVIMLIFFGLILYISNRYAAQQELIEEAALQKELKEWKYRCMTVSCELTTKCRQSQLEERLRQMGDSTLRIGKVPPFEIKRK